MTCSGCGQAIKERKAYTHDRGRVYHPGCAPNEDYERGYRAGFDAAIEKCIEAYPDAADTLRIIAATAER